MRIIAICLIIFTAAAHAQEKASVTIATRHGTVAWKELPPEKGGKVAALLREVTPDELRALRADAELAPAFLQRYAPVRNPGTHPLDQFDAAFTGWLGSSDPKKESADRVVRILGAAYGFYCIEHLGLRWAWVKDEVGEDIALVRENPTTRSFPFTSIRYRIEDQKTDFIYALYASMAHVIEEATQTKEANPSPGAIMGMRPQKKEPKWYSGEVQHEGLPLMLRFPEKPDYGALQPKYPKLVIVTHRFEKVKPSGLPEADYNDSLAALDHELLGLFAADESGVPVLVETFAGKRSYYFYVSAETKIDGAKHRIAEKYPAAKLEWSEKTDKDWHFIHRYSDEYRFYKKAD